MWLGFLFVFCFQPPKKGLFQSNKGLFGFQVYVVDKHCESILKSEVGIQWPSKCCKSSQWFRTQTQRTYGSTGAAKVIGLKGQLWVPFTCRNCEPSSGGLCQKYQHRLNPGIASAGKHPHPEEWPTGKRQRFWTYNHCDRKLGWETFDVRSLAHITHPTPSHPIPSRHITSHHNRTGHITTYHVTQHIGQHITHHMIFHTSQIFVWRKDYTLCIHLNLRIYGIIPFCHDFLANCCSCFMVKITRIFWWFLRFSVVLSGSLSNLWKCFMILNFHKPRQNPALASIPSWPSVGSTT